MALPSSGPISLNDINIELGLASGRQISLNDPNVRSFLQVASGQISLNSGYGKSNITPGSRVFTSSGQFVVPRFNTLTVVVQGGGGAGYFGGLNIYCEGFNIAQWAGGAYTVANFTDPSYNVNMSSRYGGTSSFGSYVSATGGQNGYILSIGGYLYPYGGVGGNGYGGDQNYSGSRGLDGSGGQGLGRGGAVGGYGIYASGGATVSSPIDPNQDLGYLLNSAPNMDGNTGNSYGGGGSGAQVYGKLGVAGTGGGGAGLARKTWYNNSGLAAGTTILITVGGGSPSPIYILPNDPGPYATNIYNRNVGGAGAPGIVFMSWS